MGTFLKYVLFDTKEKILHFRTDIATKKWLMKDLYGDPLVLFFPVRHLEKCVIFSKQSICTDSLDIADCKDYEDWHFMPYMTSFLALLIHGGRLLNKFHNYALYDTESSVLFSIDHMPAHPISLRVAIQDAMRCLSMLLPDRPVHSSYICRKRPSQLVAHTEAQGR
jgi:hypothetical protein